MRHFGDFDEGMEEYIRYQMAGEAEACEAEAYAEAMAEQGYIEGDPFNWDSVYIYTREVHDTEVEPEVDKPVRTRYDMVMESIERDCNGAWYANAIRGANEMRRVAYAKMTGDWTELPCYWCRFLGIGDNVPQAHTDEVTAGYRYHEYLQDYGQK